MYRTMRWTRSFECEAERRWRLVDRVRVGDFDAADLWSETFTVSNLTPSRVESSDSVIDSLQIAILGPVVVDEHPLPYDTDSVAFCREVLLSVLFDYRAVDGAHAVQILGLIVDTLDLFNRHADSR